MKTKWNRVMEKDRETCSFFHALPVDYKKTGFEYMENNAKLENLLNLALNATREEREKSKELDVGYEKLTNSWELIVKYSGDIESLQDEQRGIIVENLSNEYAILQVPENLIEEIAARPEIEYVEKPKNLYFSLTRGIQASCIPPVRRSPYNLTGRGVITAIIDSGIDYFHPDFCNPNGTTRILNIWDQTLTPREGEQAPYSFKRGVEFSREEINRALLAGSEMEGFQIVPSRDTSGHGTHVAGIAAGNGRASEGQYTGAAPESELLIVKLGYPRENAFPRTTELMTALDYVVRKSIEYQRPAAVNISIGNTYGGHSGTSLLETFMDDISSYGRSVICVGSGNEGAARGHTQGVLRDGYSEEIQLAVAPYETSISLQIWKSYVDEFDIALVLPSGQRVGPIQKVLGTQRITADGTQLLIYYGEPSPYSPYQEIYIAFLPSRDYINSGIWRIELIPRKIVLGSYNMWLPSQTILSQGTGFLYPSEETTLTIPSTASKVITVGAYDAYSMQLTDFSGRGYTRQTNQVKPDIAAPGVNITSCAPGGGYVTASGTSMATPFVTGGSALLMQWGIVDGKDPFLYGEKVKAYLIRGARQIEAVREYPNPMIGWGTLCVADSLPI